MTQSDRSDSDDDNLTDLRMAVGAGAAEAIGALTEELALLMGSMTVTATEIYRRAQEAGVPPNVAAGMVMGAAIEGLYQ